MEEKRITELQTTCTKQQTIEEVKADLEHLRGLVSLLNLCTARFGG
jgi:hypothetical protein